MSKKLPAEPFWTARGVSFAMHRYREKNQVSPGRTDYERNIRRGHRGTYPYKSSARKALSRTPYSITTVPLPAPKAWTDAEVIYLLERYQQHPIRLLAARLGRSVRATRRKLLHLQLEEQASDIPAHLLEALLSLEVGVVGRWCRILEPTSRYAYCSEDIIRALLSVRPLAWVLQRYQDLQEKYQQGN